MAPAPRTPFDDTDRLVVDGTNLLHRIGRRGAAPPAAIVGRLRAAIPAAISIDLVFDGVGHGVTGRVAQQMFVRWSGRRPADDLIVDLAADGAMEAGGGPAASARVLVVTDDRELRSRLAVRGARTLPLAWLLERLALPVLASPAPGNRRAPIGTGRAPTGSGATGGGTGAEVGDDRPGWKPGRGATAKTGPAHKVARHRRHPRHP